MLAEPVARVLGHVWTVLSILNRPMAVMGGVALSFWKRARFTQDVDLLIDVAESEVDGLVVQLNTAQVKPKRHPPLVVVGQHRFIQFVYEPPDSFLCLQIDLLLAQSDYQKQCLQRRVPVTLPGLGIEIAVLSCEDLVLFKVLAGRIIDRVDAAALLRANRATLNVKYLFDWAQQLNLYADLRDIWKEAIPDEMVPMHS